MMLLLVATSALRPYHESASYFRRFFHSYDVYEYSFESWECGSYCSASKPRALYR